MSKQVIYLFSTFELELYTNQRLSSKFHINQRKRKNIRTSTHLGTKTNRLDRHLPLAYNKDAHTICCGVPLKKNYSLRYTSLPKKIIKPVKYTKSFGALELDNIHNFVSVLIKTR